MINYLRLFIDLCLFRRPVSLLPKSDGLLLATALSYVLIVAISMTTSGALTAFFPTLIRAIGWILVVGASLYLVLRIKGFSERWNQAISAIFGALSITNIIVWPFLADGIETVQAIQAIMNDNSDLRTFTETEVTEIYFFPMLVIASINFWQIAIQTSILRQALELHSQVRIKVTLFVFLFFFNLMIASILNSFFAY